MLDEKLGKDDTGMDAHTNIRTHEYQTFIQDLYLQYKLFKVQYILYILRMATIPIILEVLLYLKCFQFISVLCAQA